jgi:hypothetical protein
LINEPRIGKFVNFILFSDYAHLFATLIARCAKDIDVLIESLPNEDSSTDLQVWYVLVSTFFFHVTKGDAVWVNLKRNHPDLT